MWPTMPAVPGIAMATTPDSRSVVACPPAIGYVVHLHAGLRREQRREQMLAAAVARRSIVDLAGAFFHVRDELRQRRDRQRRIDDDDTGLAADQRDRREVVDRLERQFCI